MEERWIHIMNKIVDLVIPIYKPDEQFYELIRRLENQTVKIGKIFLMHTEDGKSISSVLDQYNNIIEITVPFSSFDHGKTRDEAIRKSSADIVVCMTQDALPANKEMLEALIKPLEDEKIALAYARQMPRKDSRITEKFIRNFNYPPENKRKSIADRGKLGIKTFFCSNVCAAYKREVYLQTGGFECHVPLNEDMIYAMKCMKNGWDIFYSADAKVIHSHNYTYKQQFKRNFDIAVSQAQHAEDFDNISSEKEGVRLVRSMVIYLMKKGKVWYIPYFVGECVAKYLGFCLGKRYKRLPLSMVKKCSLDARFWEWR